MDLTADADAPLTPGSINGTADLGRGGEGKGNKLNAHTKHPYAAAVSQPSKCQQQQACMQAGMHACVSIPEHVRGLDGAADEEAEHVRAVGERREEAGREVAEERGGEELAGEVAGEE